MNPICHADVNLRSFFLRCLFSFSLPISTASVLALVGLTGLEPVTPRLSSACSNQLSYRPAFLSPCRLVEARGLEPRTSSLQSWRSYQLSYTPNRLGFLFEERCGFCRLEKAVTRVVLSGVAGVTHLFSFQGRNAFLPSLSKVSLQARRPKVLSDFFLLRKEVIQPQVPLRLPCYDFIPVTSLTLGHCLLAVGFAYFGCDRLP